MISISVVIPTLNEAQRLPDLLQKLKSQTHAPLEIIVCDGDSADQTAQIARDAGVTLLATERGVSLQRNAGAHASSGELLVFLDADDAPLPHFLWQVAQSYRKLPFVIACPWFVALDGGRAGKLCYLLFNLGFFLGQSTLRMGSGVCLICPRDKFLACGGFDEALHLGEDIHLIRKLCPRFGLHRHLLIPLGTSARRFERVGALKLMGFYARITPLLVLGLWRRLQNEKYDSLS
ncbi:MAG: glycosyltransferase [Armatimonadetes bacterium]|nr:glycosyltransferase [Armatimonadota bacterium]